MIVHRRHWMYTAIGMRFAKRISFPEPVTERVVKQFIIRKLNKVPLKVYHI